MKLTGDHRAHLRGRGRWAAVIIINIIVFGFLEGWGYIDWLRLRWSAGEFLTVFLQFIGITLILVAGWRFMRTWITAGRMLPADHRLRLKAAVRGMARGSGPVTAPVDGERLAVAAVIDVMRVIGIVLTISWSTLLPGISIPPRSPTAKGTCIRLVEESATYSSRWTDGLFERKFYEYDYNESDVIVWFGDRVQFQNGFGAWSNVRYACKYVEGYVRITVENGYGRVSNPNW